MNDITKKIDKNVFQLLPSPNRLPICRLTEVNRHPMKRHNYRTAEN